MSTIHVSVDQLYKLAYDTLISIGVPEKLAVGGARTLNSADARGVDSHGVSRLKFYDRCIKTVRLKPIQTLRY